MGFNALWLSLVTRTASICDSFTVILSIVSSFYGDMSSAFISLHENIVLIFMELILYMPSLSMVVNTCVHAPIQDLEFTLLKSWILLKIRETLGCSSS
ncbi:hypothetical protein CEXT_545511 [Caerostris extrusa]|uniref:Uncharacterized protein n=1 Tax=Caerostris extrusa TaxID=172846 RepID=A0AAV4NEC7_CAEEX|nr:hypothetical protein CEXT_545511 [Caerostris extrusa]